MHRRVSIGLILFLCEAGACQKQKPAIGPDGDSLRPLYGHAWQIGVKATGPDGKAGMVVKGDYLFIDGDRHVYLDKAGKVVDQGRFKALRGKSMLFRTPKAQMEMEATEIGPTRAVLKGVATLHSLTDVRLQMEMQLVPAPAAFQVPVPSSLHEAASLGDVAAIERLLASSKVDELEDGWSALMLASYWCHPAAVRRLLDAGAQPDLTSEGGKTPLLLATQSREADVIALLLAKKAKPRPQGSEDGESPLLLALHNGDLDSVRVLVDGGAPLDDKDEMGNPPLCIASLGDPTDNREDVDIVRYLLGKKVDANQPCTGDSTPLFMAVGADFVDTFRLLLDHGADPKAKDGAGRTLEEVAKDAPKILKLLRERNRR